MKKLIILLILFVIGCEENATEPTKDCADSSLEDVCGVCFEDTTGLIVGHWIFTQATMEYSDGTPTEITMAGNGYDETIIFYNNNTVNSTQIDGGITGVLTGDYSIEQNILTINGTWNDEPSTNTYNILLTDGTLTMQFEEVLLEGSNTITQEYTKQCPSTQSIIGSWIGTEINREELLINMNFTDNDFFYSSKINQDTLETIEADYFISQNINPKQIDIIIKSVYINQELEDSYLGLTSLGIYQINKDTLFFAASEPGVTVRPINFVQGLNENEGYYARVYKLIKTESN